MFHPHIIKRKENGALCVCTIKLSSIKYRNEVNSNLPNATHVAIKVHVILRRFAVLTWMCDNRELV
jgi:hypothetical protein